MIVSSRGNLAHGIRTTDIYCGASCLQAALAMMQEQFDPGLKGFFYHQIFFSSVRTEYLAIDGFLRTK